MLICTKSSQKIKNSTEENYSLKSNGKSNFFDKCCCNCRKDKEKILLRRSEVNFEKPKDIQTGDIHQFQIKKDEDRLTFKSEIIAGKNLASIHHAYELSSDKTSEEITTKRYLNSLFEQVIENQKHEIKEDENEEVQLIKSFWIIRHGHKEPSQEKTYMGKPNNYQWSLSTIGEQQASSMSEFFGERYNRQNFPLIYSSPSKRCIQTILPTAKAIGAKIRIEYGLFEPGHGIGTQTEIEEFFGADYDNYFDANYKSKCNITKLRKYILKDARKFTSSKKEEMNEDLNQMQHDLMKKLVNENIESDQDVIIVSHQFITFNLGQTLRQPFNERHSGMPNQFFGQKNRLYERAEAVKDIVTGDIHHFQLKKDENKFHFKTKKRFEFEYRAINYHAYELSPDKSPEEIKTTRYLNSLFNKILENTKDVWLVGDTCEVYSNSNDVWVKGKIVGITENTYFKAYVENKNLNLDALIKVRYKINGEVRSKLILLDCTESIRRPNYISDEIKEGQNKKDERITSEKKMKTRKKKSPIKNI
jgi:broad specificity phosphatase PhoE